MRSFKKEFVETEFRGPSTKTISARPDQLYDHSNELQVEQVLKNRFPWLRVCASEQGAAVSHQLSWQAHAKLHMLCRNILLRWNDTYWLKINTIFKPPGWKVIKGFCKTEVRRVQGSTAKFNVSRWNRKLLWGPMSRKEFQQKTTIFPAKILLT